METAQDLFLLHQPKMCKNILSLLLGTGKWGLAEFFIGLRGGGVCKYFSGCVCVLRVFFLCLFVLIIKKKQPPPHHKL